MHCTTPSIVATFDYSYLAFSAIWGWLIFAEGLDTPTVIGKLMIVLAGGLRLENSSLAANPVVSVFHVVTLIQPLPRYDQW